MTNSAGSTISSKTSSIVFPTSSSLPSHVPADLYVDDQTWSLSIILPYLFVPSHWQVKSTAGASPFITKITYILPISKAEVWWESRQHRKQIEQTIKLPDKQKPEKPSKVEAQANQVENQINSNIIIYDHELASRRDSIRRPWYSRMHLIHTHRLAWWSVLAYNVGSHALLYGGVTLFISFFSQDGVNFQANNGWTSNVLCAVSWIIGGILELIGAARACPIGKWYQEPSKFRIPILQKPDPESPTKEKSKQLRSSTQIPAERTQKLSLSDNTSDDSNENSLIAVERIERGEIIHKLPTSRLQGHENTTSTLTPIPVLPPLTPSLFFHRLDLIISSIRLIGIVLFLIYTVVFSGVWLTIPAGAMIGLVIVPIIASSALFIISGYLSLVEVTHSWSPFSSNLLTSLAWWSVFYYIIASISLLVYGILLIFFQDVLLQRDGPAYPFLIASFFYTVSDWFQMIEQGDQFYWEDKAVKEGEKKKEIEQNYPPSQDYTQNTAV